MGFSIKTKPAIQLYRELGLEDKGRVQTFTDKTVAENLQRYVSRKEGVQEDSIPISSKYGSGKVTIDVPYAEYQAYSKKIKKRVGLRGTRPFERMCADKKDVILRQVANYAKGLSK